MNPSSDPIQFAIMIATAIGALAACLAAFWARQIGNKQNEINARLLALQDYTAISVVPEEKRKAIKLLNVGKTNLYLWGFDMPGNNQRLNKPRLISFGNSEAFYWIPLPVFADLSKEMTFDFRLYLTDEFNQKWISEHGGSGTPIKSDGGNLYEVKVWSHKTYKSVWI